MGDAITSRFRISALSPELPKAPTVGTLPPTSYLRAAGQSSYDRYPIESFLFNWLNYHLLTHEFVKIADILMFPLYCFF